MLRDVVSCICLGLSRSCERPGSKTVFSLRVRWESKVNRIVVCKIRDCFVSGELDWLGHCVTAVGSRGTLATILCFLPKPLLYCKAGRK